MLLRFSICQEAKKPEATEAEVQASSSVLTPCLEALFNKQVPTDQQSMSVLAELKTHAGRVAFSSILNQVRERAKRYCLRRFLAVVIGNHKDAVPDEERDR